VVVGAWDTRFPGGFSGHHRHARHGEIDIGTSEFHTLGPIASRRCRSMDIREPGFNSMLVKYEEEPKWLCALYVFPADNKR